MSSAAKPVGSIITEALDAYRAHWRPLTAVGLFAAAPVAVLDAVISLATGRDPFTQPAPAPAGEMPAVTTDPASLAVALLSLVLFAIASAACVRIVVEGRDGATMGWGEALRFGLARSPGVLAATVIVLTAVLLGLFALVLPGLWLMVALALTTPALILERLSPLAAVRRSFQLVRGRWWRTAAVVALGVVISIGVVLVVVLPATALGLATDSVPARVLISALADTAGSAVLIPIVASVLTMLYLDHREGEGERPSSERLTRRDDDSQTSFGGFAPPAPPPGRRASSSPDGVEQQFGDDRLH